jgi:hypothetical protein
VQPEQERRDPSVVLHEDLERAVSGLKGSPEGQRFLQQFLQREGLLPRQEDIRSAQPSQEEVLLRFQSYAERRRRIAKQAQREVASKGEPARDTARADRMHDRMVQWIGVVLMSATLWYTVYPTDTGSATPDSGQIEAVAEADPPAAAAPPLRRHVISGARRGLTVRAAPDDEALRLGALPEGTEVQIVTPGPVYSEILYLDVEGRAAKGHVLSKYLKPV